MSKFCFLSGETMPVYQILGPELFQRLHTLTEHGASAEHVADYIKNLREQGLLEEFYRNEEPINRCRLGRFIRVRRPSVRGVDYSIGSCVDTEVSRGELVYICYHILDTQTELYTSLVSDDMCARFIERLEAGTMSLEQFNWHQPEFPYTWREDMCE